MNGLILFAAAEFPELLPPHGEIPPTFVEQHSSEMIAGAGALLVVVGLLVFWLRRPRPIVVIPPAESARKSLEALRGKPEDGPLIAAVSQILRRYVVAAFTREQAELTNEELMRSLAANQRGLGETRAALGDFLGECDVQKFAPVRPSPPPGFVSRALGFVEKFESQRQKQNVP